MEAMVGGTWGRGVVVAAAVGLLAACAARGPGGAAPAEAADAVFVNGKVATVDAGSSIVQAFAVRQGRFVAVGANERIMAYAGPATQVIDLRGRTVVPGLADSHLHAVGGGPGIDLSATRSIAELCAKVAEAAKGAKPGEVLVSNSDWHEAQLKEQRLPTADELEAAAPGVPVILVRGGHSYFLNNTALARYGITPATPVPPGGAIPRNAAGRLTGELTDTAKRLAPLPPPPPMTLAVLEAQQKKLNEYGLTSIRIPGTNVAAYRQFQQLRDSGKATVRYSILFRPKDLADFRSSIVGAGIRQGEGDEWVKVWGIKISVDGGFEGGYMTRPYEGEMGKGGTYYGLQTIPQATFNEYVAGINQAGWRVAVHAVGDAAVDEVLQGYERAHVQRDIRAQGWTIEHAFITRPDQYPRIRAMNLRMSVQDHLYLAAPVLRRYWGMDRASQVTPLKTYMEQGFMLAGGTDSPVIPVNPFWAMYHFLTRDTISDGVYGADQAVPSRDAVLRLMTINNARLTDEQDIKGSIEPGKLADFVVLSADYLSIPAAEVQRLKALATYVGGRQVYRAESF
ncbi:amidohydrolase [Pigmentiphaga sp. GD03639]|uniref:amidohydrolase n=1 Tax=unclassified Pigmentiphaga TaxID=2626614 RepID=UPI002446808A|nr:amidohydrolase [Pigmentiphaga sp. GD03639]MDH2237522.1 amidohydrolase [Pigmentiphaga sp. GD03639]